MDTQLSLSYDIVDGPNREALFDALRLREVGFKIKLTITGTLPDGDHLHSQDDYCVESISRIEDCSGNYNVHVRSNFLAHPTLSDFVATYNVNTRKGKTTSHKFFEQRGGVDETVRGAHLMLVVEKIVKLVIGCKSYRNSVGLRVGLKEDVARLYEAAKLVHWANTADELTSAIKNLKSVHTTS